MSLSQQPIDDLQYSFNSLYTPSYSIAGLIPLASPEDDFAPVKSTSRKAKASEHASTSSDESLEHESSSRLDKSELWYSSSPLEAKKVEPTYRKLKMNYFRKLNVVPGTSSSSEITDVAQKSLWTGKIKNPEKQSYSSSTHQSTSKFIPSFNPSPTRSSQPIKIPASTKSSKSSRQSFDPETVRDGKKKTHQMAFSLKREDSLDHSGVFDSDFEL